MEAQKYGEVNEWLHNQPAPHCLDMETVPPTPSTYYADVSDEEEQIKACLSSVSDAQSTFDTSDNTLPLLYEPSSRTPVSTSNGKVLTCSMNPFEHFN